MNTWDRFDICEAWYVYAMLWHGGQGSALYAVFGQLSRMCFRIAPSIGGPENLSENGRAIYNDLVNAKARQ